jgi:hypothetical protein
MLMEWWYGLFGGILIGLSSTLLLALNGRIAGISGMVNGAITFAATEIWRWLFLLGLVAGGLVYEDALAPQPTPTYNFAPVTMIVAGLLVGFGTRMGNGCTSGHGVCGLGRLSGRSLVAVITFMAAGIVTVFITQHMLG